MGYDKGSHFGGHLPLDLAAFFGGDLVKLLADPGAEFGGLGGADPSAFFFVKIYLQKTLDTCGG